MLRSTYRSQQSLRGLPPLPDGWSAHVAPTGHPYYYNAATKQSTYTHPATLSQTSNPPAVLNHPIPHESVAQQHFTPYVGIQGFNAPGFPGQFGHGIPYLGQGVRGSGNTHESRRRGPGQSSRWRDRKAEDRPKSKRTIPGHTPWILVKTRFERQFVHNPDTGHSSWKIPDNLKDAIAQLEEQDNLHEKGEPVNENSTRLEKSHDGLEEKLGTEGDLEQGPHPATTDKVANDDEGHQGSGSDEYEEVEVTDEEDDAHATKRQRMEGGDPDQPREFNEDDIAFQLAAMGQDYGLDPGEYDDGGEENWEPGAEGLPLTEEESAGLFKDLLDDYHINPFSTWEAILKDGKIVEDDRYTVLPNMKSRKEVWGEWSREKIQALKQQRGKAEKKNPLIPYLAFLQSNASPKLYWLEFRRKYKSAPEMRDVKVSDKQREKLYREHISRLKLPEPTRKSDLSALLKAQPLSILNRSTSLSLLPPAVLTDIRYISLDPRTRDPLIEAYISTLAPAPTEAADLSLEEQEEAVRRKQERERRERALAEREERIAAEKRRHTRELQLGRERLRMEEAEIARAMKVGKEGLKAQLGAIVNAAEGSNETTGQMIDGQSTTQD